jgi:hypothetical protein
LIIVPKKDFTALQRAVFYFRHYRAGRALSRTEDCQKIKAETGMALTGQNKGE